MGEIGRALGLITALGACAPLPHSRQVGAVTVLAVREVAWNPANVTVGAVHAVADAGDVVCVFADEGASIFASGAFVARDETAKGMGAGGAIVGSDGQTRWIVGIGPKGELRRLRGMTSFEDVGARYGLAGKRFFSAVLPDSATVAFALDGELAVVRSQKTSVYPTKTYRRLAAGGGVAVGVAKDEIDLVETESGALTRFALTGVTAAVVDRRGRLFALTSRALYAAAPDGALALVYDAASDALHGLVAAGDHVWFADGPELGLLTGGRVAETVGLGIAREATLEGSPGGDVWVVAKGKLQRFEALLDDAQARSTWSREVAPVFARSCSSCHLPGGVSGVDLSTEAAWQSKKSEIRSRVIDQRTMPPQGHPLATGDRAAIQAWLDGR